VFRSIKMLYRVNLQKIKIRYLKRILLVPVYTQKKGVGIKRVSQKYFGILGLRT